MRNFQIKIIDAIEDVLNENVDVQIKLSNGDRHVATFFTLANIQRIMKEYEETGECLNGIYFWCVDMIIVRNLHYTTIESTVHDLVEQGTLECIFKKRGGQYSEMGMKGVSISNLKESGYTIHYMGEINNPLDGYIDVEVTFTTGQRYIGSFFTLLNIQKVMDSWQGTGELLSGTYFWRTEMIVVREISTEVIESTIADLLNNEEFDEIFMRCTD